MSAKRPWIWWAPLAKIYSGVGSSAGRIHDREGELGHELIGEDVL